MNTRARINIEGKDYTFHPTVPQADADYNIDIDRLLFQPSMTNSRIVLIPAGHIPVHGWVIGLNVKEVRNP